MLRLDNKYLPESMKMFIWYLMSFQAGYINVGGFIIFGSFVSHVTGTSSRIGMGIASLDLATIITFATILISFIIGAGFAGHYIGRNKEHGNDPKFIFVTGIKACVFALVLFISEFYFGNEAMWIKLALIHLLSFACGMQNATCSLATDGFLKPTHMTGLSTDIGINLFKHLGKPINDPARINEKKKNIIRFRILLSFIFGGTIAYFIFSLNGHYGFLFPFLSSLLMFYTSIISENEGMRKKRKKVFMGSLRAAYVSIYCIFISTIIFGVFSIYRL